MYFSSPAVQRGGCDLRRFHVVPMEQTFFDVFLIGFLRGGGDSPNLP